MRFTVNLINYTENYSKSVTIQYFPTPPPPHAVTTALPAMHRRIYTTTQDSQSSDKGSDYWASIVGSDRNDGGIKNADKLIQSGESQYTNYSLLLSLSLSPSKRLPSLATHDLPHTS